MNKKNEINLENIVEAIRLFKESQEKVLFEDDFQIIYSKDGGTISSFELTSLGYNKLVGLLGSCWPMKIKEKVEIRTIYGIKMVITNEQEEENIKE